MYRHNPVRRAAALPQAPVPDWSKLARDDYVEVRISSGSVFAGTIDMIAANRSVFWVIRSDGAGRTMVYSGDDVSVTKVARRREFAAA
ncbi:hypothetical protein AB0P28_10690 [Pseudarthrobacter sp. NPDC089323]|jgi:hypothetical protein|uniref:hypothetical protein n=1 Tax=Arthrobacter sp. SD76 TaxID=3415007 RepID=UPI0034703215